MFSFTFSIFSFLYLIVIQTFRKFFLKKRSFNFNRKNLYKWMSLTKKERYGLSKSESFEYFNKRKDLLDKIRKEYKILKK